MFHLEHCDFCSSSGALPSSHPACLRTLAEQSKGRPGPAFPCQLPSVEGSPWKSRPGSPGPSTPLSHAGTCTLGSILCPGTFPGCFYLCLELCHPHVCRSLCSPLKMGSRCALWCRPWVFVLPVLSRKVLGPLTEYWGIGVRRLPPVRGGQTSSKQVKQV